ncbi:hypothetical protein AB0C65_38320 [Nocardia sp. NPDC048505]|uniref:hypothetical protein n=1 Tax=Nocardia sp. NPDC048505 TaxID=3155756 RepID=UPI0033FD5BFC
MNCFVKDCRNDPVTARDLDPGRTGGWASLSYEVALCQPHADVIAAGADWVCRGAEDGSGKEVLIGEQLKELGQFVVQSVPGTINSGKMSWHHSGVLPAGMMIPVNVQQVGEGKPRTIHLHIDAARARELAEVLEMHADIQEDRAPRTA